MAGKEKDTRAAMLFGRAFEQAVGAYFQRQDAAAALDPEWSTHREGGLHYSERDTWDHMFQQGVQLLERFRQDGRVQVLPHAHQQIRFTRTLSSGNDFVAYVDGVGELDGTPACWNGRPAPPAILRSLPALRPWIRSWFAIPG